MELQYFKTDRNGTKYYYDHNCPRCGGAGASDKWYRTGKTCYECGGSGLRRTPKIVKEYTPEYAEKLKRRRIARQKANEPDASEEELRRLADEADARQREYVYSQYGCDKSGRGFVYLGNTYKYKDTFRAAGGKWITYARLWICPQRIDVGENVEVIEIDISDKINFKTPYDYTCYELNKLLDSFR